MQGKELQIKQSAKGLLTKRYLDIIINSEIRFNRLNNKTGGDDMTRATLKDVALKAGVTDDTLYQRKAPGYLKNSHCDNPLEIKDALVCQ